MNTSNPIKSIFPIFLAAAAVVAVLSTGARAADVPQVRVRYGDLNISSSAGATLLYQRIRNAASQVCSISDQRDLSRLANAKPCVDKAIADAVAAVGNDTLTDVYQARNPKAAFVNFAST